MMLHKMLYNHVNISFDSFFILRSSVYRRGHYPEIMLFLYLYLERT